MVVFTKLDDTIELKETMRKIARTHNMVFMKDWQTEVTELSEFYFNLVQRLSILYFKFQCFINA